jgi:mannose-6-phosphate isomerase
MHSITGDHQVKEDHDRETIIKKYAQSPYPIRITGQVMHYAWGGFSYIPDLIGGHSPSQEPCAELWLGAHPGAPSIAVIDNEEIPLISLISAAPEQILGRENVSRYGSHLPFLLKVLDARIMLSIQAHPSLEQAKEGFARENAAGIPLSDPHRSYKDDNHKPEVHVALTEFWMLHGFRPLDEISDLMLRFPELNEILPDYKSHLTETRDDSTRQKLLYELYQSAMTLSQQKVDSILNPIIQKILAGPSPSKELSDYWVLRAAECFEYPDGHRDRGIFSLFFLNLAHLMPGEATYQPAGTLHAYLEGVNVELMANSDNVLRGGLTPKYVDVAELLRILSFQSRKPQILSGEQKNDSEAIYKTDAKEFELSRIDLSSGKNYSLYAVKGPEILLCIEGAAEIENKQNHFALKRGEACFIPFDISCTISPAADKTVLFRATLPCT